MEDGSQSQYPVNDRGPEEQPYADAQQASREGVWDTGEAEQQEESDEVKELRRKILVTQSDLMVHGDPSIKDEAEYWEQSRNDFSLSGRGLVQDGEEPENPTLLSIRKTAEAPFSVQFSKQTIVTSRQNEEPKTTNYADLAPDELQFLTDTIGDASVALWGDPI